MATSKRYFFAEIEPDVIIVAENESEIPKELRSNILETYMLSEEYLFKKLQDVSNEGGEFFLIGDMDRRYRNWAADQCIKCAIDILNYADMLASQGVMEFQETSKLAEEIVDKLSQARQEKRIG